MQDLQKVFLRMQETKKEQRKLKTMYRDALTSNQQYQQVMEELKALKDKKNKIEEQTKDDFKTEFSKLDNLKTDIENDRLLMSDIALTTILSGKQVELKDEKENKYEPVFSVRFKRT